MPRASRPATDRDPALEAAYLGKTEAVH